MWSTPWPLQKRICISFLSPLPDGVDYHFPGGEGAEPVTVSFAAWMLKDGNGGYKALEDPVTSKAVKPAVETEKVKRRKVLITAAFRSEMADEYALNDENGNPGTPSGCMPTAGLLKRTGPICCI